jgi:hypothetical protein
MPKTAAERDAPIRTIRVAMEDNKKKSDEYPDEDTLRMSANGIDD